MRPAVDSIARRHGARAKVAEVPPGPPVLSTLVAEVYAADDATRLEAARTYVDAFFTDTVEHFRREEETVLPLYARQPTADAGLLERVLREHMELHGLARALRAEVAAEDVSGATLEELGSLLRDHVRLEERELFEDVQRIVPPAELDALPLP